MGFHVYIYKSILFFDGKVERDWIQDLSKLDSKYYVRISRQLQVHLSNSITDIIIDYIDDPLENLIPKKYRTYLIIHGWDFMSFFEGLESWIKGEGECAQLYDEIEELTYDEVSLKNLDNELFDTEDKWEHFKECWKFYNSNELSFCCY